MFSPEAYFESAAGVAAITRKRFVCSARRTRANYLPWWGRWHRGRMGRGLGGHYYCLCESVKATALVVGDKRTETTRSRRDDHDDDGHVGNDRTHE